jgi:hypothetical protein
METLLMDPLSAMIGGMFNIAGSAMNTSSAQSINSANLQMQQQMQSGAFLPAMYKNMVSGANAAGLNPLAVLGIKSPGGGPAMAPTNPGQGLQEFGRNIAQINVEKENLDLQARREDIAKTAALTKQTNIQNAINEITMRGIEGGKYVPPGVSEPAAVSAPVSSWPGMFKSWETSNPLSVRPGSFLDRYANPASYHPSEWMKFLPRSSDYNFSVWNQ